MRIAPPTKMKSVVAVQEARWLVGKTFKNRIWSLEKGILTMSMNGPSKSIHLKQGMTWDGATFGFQVETEDGDWIYAAANSKSQWASWLQAIQNLSPLREGPKSPTKVHFSEMVCVRVIPQDEEYNTASSDEDECIPMTT